MTPWFWVGVADCDDTHDHSLSLPCTTLAWQDQSLMLVLAICPCSDPCPVCGQHHVVVQASRRYWRQGRLVLSFRPNSSSAGVLPFSSGLGLYASKARKGSSPVSRHFKIIFFMTFTAFSASPFDCGYRRLEVSGMNPHSAVKLLNSALANCVPLSDITSGISYLANSSFRWVMTRLLVYEDNNATSGKCEYASTVSK